MLPKINPLYHFLHHERQIRSLPGLSLINWSWRSQTLLPTWILKSFYSELPNPELLESLYRAENPEFCWFGIWIRHTALYVIFHEIPKLRRCQTSSVRNCWSETAGALLCFEELIFKMCTAYVSPKTDCMRPPNHNKYDIYNLIVMKSDNSYLREELSITSNMNNIMHTCVSSSSVLRILIDCQVEQG